jgi:putative peptidoglycan lipid II flippase
VRHPWTRQYLAKAGPTFLSHSVRFGSTFVDRVFASTLVAGRIAAINFAQVLAQMPLTLALNPVVTPLFSDLAQQFNHHGRSRGFHELVQRIYERSLVVVAPAVVALVLWRMPLVVFLYQHGQFHRAASLLTAHLVLFWVLGLPAEVLGIAGSRILLAQHQVRGAATAALGAMAANIIGDYLLIHRLGSTGLVIATGLAAVVRVLIQTGWLVALKTSPGPTRPGFWLRWGAAMFIFSGCMEGGYHAAVGLGVDGGIRLAAAMGLTILAALAIYGAILVRTGVVSAAQLMRGPLKRLRAKS